MQFLCTLTIYFDKIPFLFNSLSLLVSCLVFWARYKRESHITGLLIRHFTGLLVTLFESYLIRLAFEFFQLSRVKIEGTGCVLCLETEDVEAAINKAVNAGAVAEGEITEGDGACCGGRVGKVKDPYGYVWLICSPAKKCADVEA